jgi:hypothetical protein
LAKLGVVGASGGEAMKKLKWGHIDLDDDIELDPVNISEWYDVLSSKAMATLRIPTMW